MTKTTYIASIILACVAAIGSFMVLSTNKSSILTDQSIQPQNNTIATSTDKASVAEEVSTITDKAYPDLTNKLSVAEEKILVLNEKIDLLADKLEETTLAMADAQSTIVQDSNFNEEEMMTPEWVAEQDRIQNLYIEKITNVFESEEREEVWSETMETETLNVLTDMESYVNTRGTSQQVTVPYSNLPDIAVSHFSCKTNLCQMEFWTNSMDELIGYQNFMVKKTIDTLPSIVFSAPEFVGGKYRMKAYLARDEYEFPPNNS